MSDALLDTTVFIDVHLGYPRAVDLIPALRHRFERLLHSPITVFEIWLRRMTPYETARHMAFLELTTEVAFDNYAARIMATWLTTQPRSGRRRLLGDAMIAATAASIGATIITRNPRDFTRFYADVQSY
jgi:predicted nucleic acid-binding protein